MSTTKEEAIRYFDPNGPGIRGNLFGFPFTAEQAAVVVLPVPWEATVSYGEGAALGPSAILDASVQIDSFHLAVPEAWKIGMSMLPISPALYRENRRVRMLAKRQLARVERGEEIDPYDPVAMKINEACENLNVFVKAAAKRHLESGQLIGVVGGDHSTPLGLLRALGEFHSSFGILHIDAHADLRQAYEGFTYSHGSIMYNALKIRSVQHLVQVGVRDCCEEEITRAHQSNGRVKIFFDEMLHANRFNGMTWQHQCEHIVAALPPLVYISFDIDGLNPALCPGTGTPVPGGLQYEEAVYLIRRVAESGRRIIGFDLCEVGRGTWDGNVGARLLYQLCTWAAVSNPRTYTTG